MSTLPEVIAKIIVIVIIGIPIFLFIYSPIMGHRYHYKSETGQILISEKVKSTYDRVLDILVIIELALSTFCGIGILIVWAYTSAFAEIPIFARILAIFEIIVLCIMAGILSEFGFNLADLQNLKKLQS